jgi:hemolysin activation/secretion protein
LLDGRAAEVDAVGVNGNRRRLARAACRLLAVTLTVVALGSGDHAHGQAVDIAPLISPPLPRVTPQPQPEVLPPPPSRVEPAAPVEEGPPLRVDDIRIEGVTVYDPAVLRPLYADLPGTSVSRSRLAELVDALQTRYRNDGYILTVVRARVERPGGRTIFVVQAIEGYISEVKLDGDIGPAGTLAYNFLEHLTWLRPLNNADLERYLLLVQDIPGVSIRSVLRHVSPEPGAVQLVAQLSRRPFGATLQYDNRGSDEVGPHELLLSGTANSFTSAGEQVEAIFFNTFNREQLFGQINAAGFLGSEGLKLRGYFGRGNSQPGGALAGTGFDSDLQIGGVGVSYPWIRSRRLNLSTDASFDVYDASIAITGGGGVASAQNESHLRILRAGGALDFQDSVIADLPAANVAVLKVSHGLQGLGASSNSSALPARAGNKIDFTKLTGEITRVQNLATFGEVGTALKLSLGGQYTGDVLPPSEKYFLGGTRFGRGFFNGQVTGDRAIGATVELQVNVPFTDVPFIGIDHRLDVQFYAFYDYGRSFDLGIGDIDHTIDSIGLGARSDVTSWLFVELEGVHRLTTRPTGSETAKLADYAVFSRVVIRY